MLASSINKRGQEANRWQHGIPRLAKNDVMHIKDRKTDSLAAENRTRVSIWSSFPEIGRVGKNTAIVWQARRSGSVIRAWPGCAYSEKWLVLGGSWDAAPSSWEENIIWRCYSRRYDQRYTWRGTETFCLQPGPICQQCEIPTLEVKFLVQESPQMTEAQAKSKCNFMRKPNADSLAKAI